MDRWTVVSAVAGLAAGAGIAALMGLPLLVGVGGAAVGMVTAALVAKFVLHVEPKPLILGTGAIMGSILGGLVAFAAVEALSAGTVTTAGEHVAVAAATATGGAYGGGSTFLVGEAMKKHGLVPAIEDERDEPDRRIEGAPFCGSPPSETKGFVRALH